MRVLAWDRAPAAAVSLSLEDELAGWQAGKKKHEWHVRLRCL